MTKNMSSNKALWYNLLVVFLLSAGFASNLEGQEIWTADQFLNFDQSNESLPFEDNLDFLNNKAKGMPFVDQYEFRTETDEMQFDQQQYQFRFKFNSGDERKAYDKILIANKSKYEWLQRQYELDVWEEKYKNIVDLYFNQKEMDLVRQDLELLADKKRVLRKLLDSDPKIEVTDWVTIEGEIFNALSDSLNLTVEKKEISQRIFGTDRDAPLLDESNIIGFSEVKEIVSELMSSTYQHPDEGLAMSEEIIAGAEYKLELAESKRWLEFAQIQYQSDNKLSFQNELSFGTSITIPNKNNNRVKKNEAALELLEKSYETKIKQEENKKEVLTEESKILGLIDQLEGYKKMRDDQKLNAMYESYSEKKIVSPLVLIGIKRAILNNDKKQLDIEKDIYESYINLLTKKAVFLSVPSKNYLKKD